MQSLGFQHHMRLPYETLTILTTANSVHASCLALAFLPILSGLLPLHSQTGQIVHCPGSIL